MPINPFRNRPILVTGSHRSGSTWLGKMLSLTNRVEYVPEPFNKKFPPKGAGPIKYWFEYISGSTPGDLKKEFKNYIAQFIRVPYRYYISGIFKSIIKLEPRRGFHLLKLFFNRIRTRVLLKDPICIFSAEWIEKEFNSYVVIIIRHPAAFVASLKVKNWEHDFNEFLNQKNLMSEVLYPFETEMRELSESKKDIIEQGILLWNLIHYRILEYRKEHPDWIFIRHEDLSRNPIEEFSSLYDKLKIKNFDKIQAEIGEHVTTDKGKLHRNSKENIYSWKIRLTEEEILRIQEGTGKISKHFYSEKEW